MKRKVRHIRGLSKGPSPTNVKELKRIERIRRDIAKLEHDRLVLLYYKLHLDYVHSYDPKTTPRDVLIKLIRKHPNYQS